MRISIMALLAVTLPTGCVVFDHNCSGKDCIDGSLSDADTGTEGPTFWLSPDSLTVGETVIVTLESDQTVDFEGITDLHFYGDVDLLASQPRDDELLLTVQTPGDAVTGEVDLVIQMEDGTTTWVDAAFTLSHSDSDSTGSEDDTSEGSGSPGGSTGEDPENSDDCE
ncbi:MAG: hypothetical protein QGG40_11125 [Myxococcota bacterium]|jgi:hypothetical protein|nr:hypothetical protein [Myxococcota bacterium]